MDDTESFDDTYRWDSSTDQRLSDARLTIDPGFVNHRLVRTIFPNAASVLDQAISGIPDMPEGLKQAQIDHIYKDVVLAICSNLEVPGLNELLSSRKGRVFCSVLDLAPTPAVYDEERVSTLVAIPGVEDPEVRLEYSTSNVRSDTLRMRLADGAKIAVVAKLDRNAGGTLWFEPLVMGPPWLVSEAEQNVLPSAEWFSYDFFEIFIEDFDQFAQVKTVPMPDSIDIMGQISENAMKICLTEILGDTARKDWGGEMSDHFASHVSLKGKATTAAFLLKGPAHFAPMNLNHLGKNNDQIYRLAQEPAQVLIVQHCHDVTSPVRATLRAFAVRPGASRRYCIIDGRDSLRLLIAYGKLERALELTAGSR